ncbi:DNA repair protein RecO [Aestuariimicrobium sp. T2.26MG-19.2B]|uniref:DNA repair protein RecO n=1 Tax=Aestuariimicrobium sp. T2.26MG-19.2B TaxID=3040679 RepID=UPI0024773EFE|nr:DNA repair protein RecO [Aestuariimicrobium sp. T2.26MG-19.2B]CAI9411194.1 DNA repair protein RecO [Aestuariimicrobium sp. T2.26MG-19.2B]
MPSYRDEAIVLRTHKLGEADRIITLLTRTHGKVRAVARGVRRTSSKFGGRLEPFRHVDLQVIEGRSLDICGQVQQLHAWSEPILADYERYTAGQVMLETVDRLVSVENEPALRHYLLLAGALRVLGEGTTDGPRSAGMILDSYLLRSLSLAGYSPALDSCAACGRVGPHPFFSPSSGGMVCGGCRGSGAVRVSADASVLLAALVRGDWPSTRAATPMVQRQVSGIVSAFATWHLEHGLRSFSHVERSFSAVVGELDPAADQSAQSLQSP